MAVGGAYIAFNNRLTILETKDGDKHASDNDGLAEVKSELAELRKDLAVCVAKIDSLEVAQTKHNNLMERTFRLEAKVDTIENRLD